MYCRCERQGKALGSLSGQYQLQLHSQEGTLRRDARGDVPFLI